MWDPCSVKPAPKEMPKTKPRSTMLRPPPPPPYTPPPPPSSSSQQGARRPSLPPAPLAGMWDLSKSTSWREPPVPSTSCQEKPVTSQKGSAACATPAHEQQGRYVASILPSDAIDAIACKAALSDSGWCNRDACQFPNVLFAPPAGMGDPSMSMSSKEPAASLTCQDKPGTSQKQSAAPEHGGGDDVASILPGDAKYAFARQAAPSDRPPCWFYRRGRCTRDECWFPHMLLPDPPTRTLYPSKSTSWKEPVASLTRQKKPSTYHMELAARDHSQPELIVHTVGKHDKMNLARVLVGKTAGSIAIIGNDVAMARVLREQLSQPNVSVHYVPVPVSCKYDVVINFDLPKSEIFWHDNLKVARWCYHTLVAFKDGELVDPRREWLPRLPSLVGQELPDLMHFLPRTCQKPPMHPPVPPPVASSAKWPAPPNQQNMETMEDDSSSCQSQTSSPMRSPDSAPTTLPLPTSDADPTPSPTENASQFASYPSFASTFDDESSLPKVATSDPYQATIRLEELSHLVDHALQYAEYVCANSDGDQAGFSAGLMEWQTH